MTFSEYLEITTKYGITFYHMPTDEEVKNTDKTEFESALKNLNKLFKGRFTNDNKSNC